MEKKTDSSSDILLKYIPTAHTHTRWLIMNTLTWPNISRRLNSCPVKTPRQMKTELNWPMEPRYCRGEISARYIGNTLRDTPEGRSKRRTEDREEQLMRLHSVEVMYNSSNYSKLMKMITLIHLLIQLYSLIDSLFFNVSMCFSSKRGITLLE